MAEITTYDVMQYASQDGDGVRLALPGTGVLTGWWRWPEQPEGPIYQELRLRNHTRGDWDVVSWYQNELSEEQFRQTYPGYVPQAIQSFQCQVGADHLPEVIFQCSPFGGSTSTGALLKPEYVLAFDSDTLTTTDTKVIYWTGADTATPLPTPPAHFIADYRRYYDPCVVLQSFTYTEADPEPEMPDLPSLPERTTMPLTGAHGRRAFNFSRPGW